VRHIVIPAVAASNFAIVRDLAHATPGAAYALGIHPMATPDAHDGDLDVLAAAIEAALGDPRFVAIGEIGLDFFVAELKLAPARQRQQQFYVEQLRLARHFGLPVLLHVRRSQDELLAQLRRMPGVHGIAHAFNGSAQQAAAFIGQGFCLGFGGAMTFERALNIRRLARDVPPEALVLETDAPDIAPAWRHRERNAPAELPRIAKTLAELRGWSLDQTASTTLSNARRVLPRLAGLLEAGAVM
jgi:TatD DNase family protein